MLLQRKWCPGVPLGSPSAPCMFTTRGSWPMDHLPCRHGSETRRPAHGQRERRRAIGNCHFDREQPTNTQQGNKSTTGQKGRGFPVRGEPCIHCGARRRPRPRPKTSKASRSSSSGTPTPARPVVGPRRPVHCAAARSLRSAESRSCKRPGRRQAPDVDGVGVACGVLADRVGSVSTQVFRAGRRLATPPVSARVMGWQMAASLKLKAWQVPDRAEERIVQGRRCWGP